LRTQFYFIFCNTCLQNGHGHDDNNNDENQTTPIRRLTRFGRTPDNHTWRCVVEIKCRWLWWSCRISHYRHCRIRQWRSCRTRIRQCRLRQWRSYRTRIRQCRIRQWRSYRTRIRQCRLHRRHRRLD